MSNDISTNPLVIDSTGSLTTKNVEISLIRWVGATDTSHTVVIKNAAAKTIWASSCPVVGTVDNSPMPPEFQSAGITIGTIGSGTVYIYLSKEQAIPIT